MLRKTLTVVGFLASVVLLGMALIMIGAMNLVLNGYHRECKMWENVVPFACSPRKEVPSAPRQAVRQSAPVPNKTATAKPATRPAPKPAQEPRRGSAVGAVGPTARICGNYQPEPYRVQCDPESGVCYHDSGHRGACGLADNR